jgi:phage shock protein C
MAARRRLYRSRTDRQLAGVAGGIADYLDIDPTVIRVLWVISIFFGGIGLLLYIILAFVMPLEPLGGPAQGQPGRGGLQGQPGQGAPQGQPGWTPPQGQPSQGAPAGWTPPGPVPGATAPTTPSEAAPTEAPSTPEESTDR